MADPIKLCLPHAHFAASDEAAGDGSVGLVVYTGAAVLRAGYYEDAKGREQYGRYTLRLSMDPKAVDLGRLDSGAAPLLREHRQDVDAVLGVVVAGSAKLDSALTARAILSDAPGDADAVHRIRSGIARNLSVGAFLHRIEAEDLEADPPRFVATRWEPFEVSSVAVGADAGASVALALDLITPPALPAAQEPVTMSTATAPAPAGAAPTFSAEELKARNSAVRESARLLGLSGAPVDSLIDDATLSLDAARSKMFELKASADAAHNVSGARGVEVLGADEGMKRLSSIQAALVARQRGTVLADKDAPHAREFRFARLVDIARWCLRQRGMHAAADGADSSVVAAALAMRSEGGMAAYLAGHASSDFPLLLADSARKELRAGYEAAQGIHSIIARQRTLRDYLSHKHVMLGDTPDFIKLAENGKPNYGPLTESGGSVALDDYSSAVEIGRRLILGDDLDALLDLPRRFGARAKRKEHSLVCAVLTGGASGDWGDGNALFSAAHLNIAATTGAPSVSTLTSHRLRMAKQTGLVGTGQTAEPLDISTRYVIVPEALRVTAEQLLGGMYMPNAATSAVPRSFEGYEVVSTATLDDSSATAWYTAADPALGLGLEYCYLEGESGVVVSSMPDWDTEGVKIKARLAFAAHAKDYRGLTYTAS